MPQMYRPRTGKQNNKQKTFGVVFPVLETQILWITWHHLAKNQKIAQALRVDDTH